MKILIYGSIRYSKSIEEIIILVKKLKIKFEINVTIAGKHEQDVKKLLSKKNLIENEVYENFKIINKFINPIHEKQLFLETDLVWCYYKNTPLGSSGVFHLSNLYKKPVVTNKDGLLGWYNTKYKLGPILSFDSKKNVKKSVDKIFYLMKNKKKYKQYCINQIKLNNLMKKQKNFHSIIKNLMT